MHLGINRDRSEIRFLEHNPRRNIGSTPLFLQTIHDFPIFPVGNAYCGQEIFPCKQWLHSICAIALLCLGFVQITVYQLRGCVNDLLSSSPKLPGMAGSSPQRDQLVRRAEQGSKQVC